MITVVYRTIVLIVVAIALASACDLSGSGSRPLAVQIGEPQFSLRWDPPMAGQRTGRIEYYRVYYRGRGEVNWSLLGHASASKEPSFSVSTTMLSYGAYEFAVSTVDIDGAESDLHSSVDRTADPAAGWYVRWYGPPQWYIDWMQEE